MTVITNVTFRNFNISFIIFRLKTCANVILSEKLKQQNPMRALSSHKENIHWTSWKRQIC